MSGKNPHLTCNWPPKQPCLKDPRPGVRCSPIIEEDRLECNFPQKPDFAIDHKEPIVVEWPPRRHIGQGDWEEDTGMRPDLLCKIPDQIVPQVVTVHGTPEPAPGQAVSPVQYAKLPHPLFPDGQMHMEITPQEPVKTEIRIPDLGCAVRQPLRRWKQCIENTLVNDRVRRPMARWCHKRRLPPIVIPITEYQRLKDKCTETERKAKEKADRIRGRECLRLESRRRQGKWNYTVESLLDRKKAQEESQEKAEKETFQHLLKEIKAGKDLASAEQLARAKKLQMYRKGLIQDLHSALAYSKMMQDIERAQRIDEKEDESEQTLPICEQKCMKKMLAVPDFSEYPAKKKEAKKVNERLRKTLVNIETRQKEQEREVNNQICAIKKLLKDNRPQLPEVYLKHVKEPECRESSLQEKFLNRRDQFYEEIDEKLTVNAYIESHEEEMERQACEYAKFLQHKDYIRKETERKLIEEKVKSNIEKSEKAAAVLVAMRTKKQKENAHDYDALKEQWESEVRDKEEEIKAKHEALIEKVKKDFIERKAVENCKSQLRDGTRLWARERLVAAENYEQDCERQNTRRQKAEEIQLYNLALASEKKCQVERLKLLDNAIAAKIKAQYFEEMQEMKDYAGDCIREWKGKGRSSIPMHMAMKKWEYDSQMDPRMFREYEKQKEIEANKKQAERGGGDCDFAEVIITQGSSQNPCKQAAPLETTQSTGRRLGLC